MRINIKYINIQRKEEKVVPSTSTDKPMPGKRPPMRTGGLSGLASQLSGNKKQKLSATPAPANI